VDVFCVPNSSVSWFLGCVLCLVEVVVLQRVFDVGCGWLRTSYGLKEASCNILLIDIFRDWEYKIFDLEFST
jgi:hypothetical protein